MDSQQSFMDRIKQHKLCVWGDFLPRQPLVHYERIIKIKTLRNGMFLFIAK
jgi:hypothetical protein